MTKKTTADEARELYEHRNDPDEWEDEPEQIEIRPARTAVLSVRLPREVMDAVEAAAAASGQSLSEYVRSAVESRLRGATFVIPSVINRSTGYPAFEITQDDVSAWSRPAEVAEASKRTLEAVEPVLP
ncbi:MAG TPA: ribbon-helix-helix protein, CopG family [Ktedonobacterales bacterium]|nr:ribbon-helix-helix protein, CopG family [Ktedonobacterales bacterium]